jgi:hypothetical protein
MKLILPAAVALAFTLLCAPAQAQSDAEQAGQQACGNDVFAMCGDAIPDRGRIEACLRRNFSRVSAPCRHYMASYGHAHSARNGQRHHYTRHSRRYRSSHATRHSHYDHKHVVRHHKRRHHTYR